MRRLTTIMTFAALGAGVAQPALAVTAEPIGTTLAVVNVVTAELSTERRNLATGDGVRQDELIEAAPDARSEFKLADDTKLALGPGARMVLDKFVYDPAKKSGTIAVDLAKGAFRFMTGIASKPSYVVRVPSAAITVRGTIFDVFVQDNGAAWLLLHEGGVRVCNDTGACRNLSEPGKLIMINEGGDVSKPFRWASMKGEQGFSFDDAFPFVGTAPSIDPRPHFTKEALLQEEPAPAKRKPVRKAKAESAPVTKANPTLAALPKPNKQDKVAVRTPKSKPQASEDIKPVRVVSKPPRIKLPKRDREDLESDGESWKEFGRRTANVWIKRVRGTKYVEDGPSGTKIARPSDLKPHHTGSFKPPAGLGVKHGTKVGGSRLSGGKSSLR